MSVIQLDKINSEFRYLVDLLFFTDRLDIDLSSFYDLLQSNRINHLTYLVDRFDKSANVYWNQGDSFWTHRLYFLLSLNDKFITRHIDHYIRSRMAALIKSKKNINSKYDLEYLQFIIYCQVKYNRHDNVDDIKNYFINISPQIRIDKLIEIINSIIPYVFNDIDEYAAIIYQNIINCARNFEILQALEKQNIIFDKQPIVQLAQELIIKRTRSKKNINILFTIINDQNILKQLKAQYKQEYRHHLLEFLSNCDYQELEEYHLRNIKNILTLDPVIADDLAVIYADKLYSSRLSHKKANADRLIRLMKNFSQISPKKILAYLSNHNKMTDIKYMLITFPSLRKLSAFV
jgi:hypothetical protein